jgi:hypothetical protein
VRTASIIHASLIVISLRLLISRTAAPMYKPDRAGRTSSRLVDLERERLRRTKEGLILSDRREKGAQVERETEGLGQLGLIEPQRNQ